MAGSLAETGYGQAILRAEAMKRENPKLEHIATLAENFGTPTVKALLALMEIMINEARIDNDVAVGDDILKNQGKIAGYVKLRDYICNRR